jgi:hypothetical protein
MKKSLGMMVAIMLAAILMGTFIAAKSSTAGEKAREGRFIAYDNGMVLDTQMSLMWATSDNGSDIDWANANTYCKNYRGGGYTDWRMPTYDELLQLYDHSLKNKNGYRLTNLITLTKCCSWASEASRSVASYVNFQNGMMYWSPRSHLDKRVLPVRSVKQGDTAEPVGSPKGEKAREGPFVAYDNGTVLDRRTNLMWAASDNVSDIDWMNAKTYCENYRGGGYTDWRMPTKDELQGLYGNYYYRLSPYVESGPEVRDVHITRLIHLTSYVVWASETRGSEAAAFRFKDAWKSCTQTGAYSHCFGRIIGIEWHPQSETLKCLALPVRSAK